MLPLSRKVYLLMSFSKYQNSIHKRIDLEPKIKMPDYMMKPENIVLLLVTEGSNIQQ